MTATGSILSAFVSFFLPGDVKGFPLGESMAIEGLGGRGGAASARVGLDWHGGGGFPSLVTLNVVQNLCRKILRDGYFYYIHFETLKSLSLLGCDHSPLQGSNIYLVDSQQLALPTCLAEMTYVPS